MHRTNLLYALALSTSLLSLDAHAQQLTRVRVTVENLAPGQGTFQTPFWAGFHDGTFDLYDQGVAASGPLGSDALERIAEDGNAGPLVADFAASPAGTVDGLVFGPTIPPIGPGEVGTQSFLVDGSLASSRYFSYASMVIPSNDAFIANGNPMAHRVFDDTGNFVGQSFFVGGNEVLDAGTEVNDELPANTAFFGQAMPNTGTDENGLVQLHPGFLPAAPGNILGDFRFAAGMFDAPGFAMVRVGLAAAPAITDARRYRTLASSSETTHGASSTARGRFLARLQDGGTRIEITFMNRQLRNVVSGTLHLGAAGSDGPIVANLVGPLPPGGGLFNQTMMVDLDASGLTGPLAGMPLDALVARMDAGEVYVSFATDDGQPGDDTGPGDFVSGEIRGQLTSF